MSRVNSGRSHNHSFAMIPHADIPRSAFNRSSNYKTTFDAGFLVPIWVDEALPGDTINMDVTVFARMATPIYPVLDNMYLETFVFAVPIRLVWDNFKKMMGEQVNPGDSTDFLVPQLVSGTGGFARGGLEDYMGIPPLATSGTTHSISALWHRAYNLIWNEWFRDQNLQNSLTVPKGDGPDSVSTYTLQRRGKRHDYFTSALPWPQKGTSVTLPLGVSAPVTIAGSGTLQPTFTGAGGAASALQRIAGAGTEVQMAGNGNAGNLNWANPNLSGTADLSAATAATINQIRQAFQIQRLYERDARGGTRYTEVVRSHFGVTSPDARLQRPEYLGGGQVNISVNPVPTTAEDGSAVRPLGDLGAFAVAAGPVGHINKSFTEHCVLICLASVRADLNYQQGTPRMFSRRTRFDFYWPALAHLGEQAVLSKEIYTDGSANDNNVWGYQERYAEYRYKPSVVTGKLRTSDPGTLDSWHLAQNFATRPLLNGSFIAEDPPMARVISIVNEPHFIMDAHFRLKHIRPMPTYGVPGLIDHF